MQSILLSREEVARRAKEIYDNSIRQQVEREENSPLVGEKILISQGRLKPRSLVGGLVFPVPCSLSLSKIY